MAIYGHEIPEAYRELVGFGVPYKFEKLDLPVGPRALPSWAQDAMINWRWGYCNRPDYLIRCRYDPLAFTDGAVWRLLEYDDVYDAGAKSMGRKPKGRAWIAESEGVALCHYHSGTIRMVNFEDNVTNEKGEIVWEEKPDWRVGNPGIAKKRAYSMLATDEQQGYAGRAFEITLAAQEIPIWDESLRRDVLTPVEAGTKLKLRGPWHGSAPKGYREVSYQYDREPYVVPKRKTWQRKWHERMGYFGLCIKPEILLDIMATYQPHVEWALMTFADKDKDRVCWEPLHPEIGLPKGWQLDPNRCEHDFMISNYSMGRKPRPSDDCRWCRAKRDPEWFPVDYRGEPAAWWKDRKPGLTFDRYLTSNQAGRAA